jgi:tetratricopeptide (TPR) repeat protein
MALGLALLVWAGQVRYHAVSQVASGVAHLSAKVSATAPPSAAPTATTVATAAPAVASRGEAFLIDGERSLSEGDLEKAQGDFDKASVLMDRDSRVLLDEARVAAAKADIPWLKLRVLSRDAVDGVQARTAKAQLAEAVAIVRRAAADALSAAPDDPRANLAVVDALRLAGEVESARAYVGPALNAGSPESAPYVLAALDMARPSPPWSTVIAGLRTATAQKGGEGRARAALVYALAESGDVEAAHAELVKLDALPRPYPLQPDLQALVSGGGDRAPVAEALPPAPNSSATSRASEPASAPPAPRSGGGAAISAWSPSPRENPGDALEAATNAVARHDPDRAERIYEGLLAKNPDDSQAVAGLGDVAMLRGDSAGAISAYRRAVALNPSYLPALLGLADTQWARGDRDDAARMYKDIVRRFPEGTYPSYVERRAGGG